MGSHRVRAWQGGADCIDLVGHPENFGLYTECHCRVLSRRRMWFVFGFGKDHTGR